MDDPSAWELATTASGGAAITDGRLTLSVRMPRAYHSARRPAPIVGDFFAEVDLYTEVCNPGDEIGLTARGRGLVEQYRFLIGCDGTARITRVLEEGSRALTLRVASPAIQAGAPTHNHLAIWLRGLDLKLFVNGDEVLTVRRGAGVGQPRRDRPCGPGARCPPASTTLRSTPSPTSPNPEPSTDFESGLFSDTTFLAMPRPAAPLHA
jgi:hypothetical protein